MAPSQYLSLTTGRTSFFNGISQQLFKFCVAVMFLLSAVATSAQVIVQAESYITMSGVQTETTADVGGGQNVGWIDAGDWMSYSVTLPAAGNYTVSFRVASPSGGGSIRLEKSGGGTVYGQANVSATGGWQTWQTITQVMALPAGQQSIGFAVVTGGFNLNWIKFEPVPTSSSSSSSSVSSKACSFAATLEAESYSTMLGVQTETTADVGGGLNVGWIDDGDLMSYAALNLPFSGTYRISYRVAAPNTGGVIQILPSQGSMYWLTNVSATGGWQNWVTITQDVTLSLGPQAFKLTANTGGFNLNWIKVESITNGCSSSVPPSSSPSSSSSSAYPATSSSSSKSSLPRTSTSSSSSSVSSSTTSSSSSWSSDRNRYDAPRATTAPIIDGVADEVWNKAAWAPIDVFWLGSQHPTAADFSGRYKAMWDAGNVYLLFDITDDILLDATANPLDRYWDDDSVEIFIDENKNGGNHQYNTSAWAYHVSTLGDTVDFTNTTAVQLLNSHITVRRVSVGSKHMWEMSMRVYGENYVAGAANIPVALFAGKLMGFSVCYNDNDSSAQRESMIGSVDTQGHKNDMGYKDASVFGSMRLIEAP